MLIHPYHESVVSQLYPGAQHSANCLVPAVTAFETLLALPPEHRSKVVWRLDQGFGGDHNINWLLDRRYGVLAKGCSNRRAALLAQQVKRWRAVRDDKWVGSVRTPAGFSHPLETFAIRYTVPTKDNTVLSSPNETASAGHHHARLARPRFVEYRMRGLSVDA